jgi:2-hydroxy-6-oxonona-2,4-dienedioate hydrolase
MPSVYKGKQNYAEMMAWYDAQVAQLPVDAASRWVETRAGATHLLTAGNPGSPPVVLLHGMNMNALAMAGAITALAPSHRVYALDIIGMAGKSAGTRYSRSGDAYPHWLVDVLDALQLVEAAFVGVSFGGWLILRLAALAPERISQAVLLDSGGLTPFTIRGQMVSGITALRYILRPTAANLARAAAPFYAPQVTPDPTFVELLGLGYRHITLDVKLSGLPPVAAPELAHWHAPVLLIYGAHDIFFDAEQALARARTLIPNLAGAEILPHEGHLWSPTTEAAVYARVANFLRNPTEK